MIRRRIAIHEAAHAVMAHYSGMQVIKLSLTKEGGESETSMGSKQDRFLGIKHFWVLAVGSMADYMSSGDLFWSRNPKSVFSVCFDVQAMKDFNFNKNSTKADVKKTLLGLHTFLCHPHIWGKVECLADALRDSPNGLLDKDIDSIICKAQRERIPEHDPAPLIEYLVDELFQKKDKTQHETAKK